jgi:protein involved in polysaccharide export with SLBB domain
MEFELIRHGMTLLERSLRAAALLLLSAGALAQNVQLSAEQQLMLNQLPPEQRQQAMDALRQLNSQQQQSPQSINETISEFIELEEQGDLEAPEEPRAEARSRLVIGFELPEDMPNVEKRELEEDPVMQRLIGSHLFILDDDGILSLDGLASIPLLGLTEEDIQRRLEAETYLSKFIIDTRILGQEPIGVEALEPFGYDVFERREASLQPPTSGPVPQDYVLGPGDTVRVQLFGNVNGIYEYEVSRDGVLNLPQIGPVTVAGIPFSEFRQDLNERVREMLIGTQVSVTMGQLRTIRVFVLGDVEQPGSYVVSGLATMSGALYYGGGISEVGTLRDIQLKRNGRVVSRLDLYELLLNGDTSSDARLQPGDVIFVPPVGDTVSVAGAVKRPAIYETKGETSVAGIIRIAGGLAPDAYAGGVRIGRIDGDRKTVAVDLADEADAKRLVRSGDTVIVPEVLPSLQETVVLTGHVYRPGNYEWRPGMHLTDLIRSTDELKPGVDTGYILIRREKQRGQPIQVVSANLAAALQAPASAANVSLEASDTVHVFSLALGRQRVVEPLVEELRLQSTIDAPAREVEVSGDVRAPGVYPLETGMRISDLIRAGGSLSQAAYAHEAELTRYSMGVGMGREISVVKVDLNAIRQGDAAADLVLREHDYLIINRVPEWDTAWTVSLQGEVKFPGEYRVRRGETLAEVLQRAGGLTDNAFPEGAVFLRESLRERETEQIEMLARRLEADLASISLQSATEGGTETLDTGRALLDQLRDTEAVGRLVIDLAQKSEIELRDGDELLVPTRTQVVTVLGETQQNTSHLYDAALSRDEYINLSGGLTRRADKRRIYVVRASGAVVSGKQSRWLGRGGRTDIRPGDTIVVPLDADKMRPMTFWTNVTQILYQAAIAVAAVQTFNN